MRSFLMIFLGAILLAMPHSAQSADRKEVLEYLGNISALVRFCGYFQSNKRLNEIFGKFKGYNDSHSYWYQRYRGADALEGLRCARIKKKADEIYDRRGEYLQFLEGSASLGAIDRVEVACSSGDASACNTLGLRYDKGEGVEQDYGKAVALFRQACDGGNMWGCNNLGISYRKGEGVKQDYGKAVVLFRQACDGGNMTSCNNLGVRYEMAEGVKQDYGKAVALYRQACGGGSMLGCSNLGEMHESGKGVSKDYDKAIAFYRQACDGENGRGCANLGLMYKEGRGVPKDYAKGKALIQQACKLGAEWACRL